MQIVVTLCKVAQLLSLMAAVTWLALAIQQKSVADQTDYQYFLAKVVQTSMLDRMAMALSAVLTTLVVQER